MADTRIDAIGTALTEDTLVGSVSNYVGDFVDSRMYHKDESYDINNNLDILDGIDASYWDNFNNVRNERHAQHLKRKYTELSNDSKYLDSLGVEGVGYRVMANLLELPLAIAMTPASTAVKAGTFGAKVAESPILRASFTALTEGSIEGIKQITSPKDRDDMDMLIALGGGAVAGAIYKPDVFDTDTVDIVKKHINNTVDDVVTNGKATPSSTEEVVNNSQFNVSSVFKEAPSESMKAFGDNYFLDVLNPKMDKYTSIEKQLKLKDTLDGQMQTLYRPLYSRYMNELKGKTSSFANHLRTSGQEEFFETAGKLARGIEDDFTKALSPELREEMLKANKEMSLKSHDIMKESGHTKFIDGSIEQTDDYLPLSWMKDKVSAHINMGTLSKQDFRSVVAVGLRNKMTELGLVIDEDRILAGADKFTATMTAKDVKVGEAGFIAKDNMINKALDDLSNYLDLSEVDRIKLQEAMAKTKTEGTASATKHRTPLDLSATYTNEAGKVIKLSDYVNTNLQDAWHRYSTTMSGDLALRDMGIESRESLHKLRQKVVDELTDATGNIPEANQKYLTSFDQTVGHLLGMTAKDDPNGTVWKTVRSLNNLTRASKLGATWFALSAEVARSAHQAGFMNLMKSVPALKDALTTFRGKKGSAVYQELQSYQAIGNHFLEFPSIAKYEDTYGDIVKQGSSKWLDNIEKFSYTASEATMQMGGAKSGSSLLEQLNATATHKKMIDLAFREGGLKPRHYHFFSQYGFSKETTDKITDNIRRNVDRQKWGADMMNFANWDEGLQESFNLGLRRKSYELVQRSNFGDNVGVVSSNKLVGDTPLGALGLSLKNYMITAYNKQLSKGVTNLSKGGYDRQDVIGDWITQSVATSLAYAAKVHTQYGDDESKMREMLTPEKIAMNSFSMTTFSSFLPSVVDAGANIATGEPVFSSGARNTVPGMPTIAPLSFATDVATGVAGVGKLLSPGADANAYELHKGLNSLPMSNAIGMKQLTREMSEILAELDD